MSWSRSAGRSRGSGSPASSCSAFPRARTRRETRPPIRTGRCPGAGGAAAGVPDAVAVGRRLPLRIHESWALRAAGDGSRRARGRRQRRGAAAAREGRAGVRAGRRGRRRPVGHDGRPRGRHPPQRSTTPVGRMSRSCRTRPSTRPGSTGRSARPPDRRRSSAIGAGTRWTRPTPRRRSARSSPTSTKGADIVMVKPALPYLDVIAPGEGRASACRWPPTTSPASTR